MVTISVINKPTPWLRYLIDTLIANLPFHAEASYHETESEATGDVLLAYGVDTTRPIPCIQIPYSESSLFHGNLSYRREGHSLYFSDDILRPTFESLSCLQEDTLERSGSSVSSLAANIPLEHENWKTPWVNRVLRELEQALYTIIPDACKPKKSIYPDNAQFAVCLTHDVDTLNPTVKTVLKQTRHTLFRSLAHAKGIRIKALLNEWSALFRKAFAYESYWNFDTIRRIERKFGFNSTYNVFAHTPANTNGFIPWLYNPEYDITNHRQLQNTLKSLQDEGDEIAVHGSYESYASSKLLTGEIDTISKVFNSPVRGGRQHFLQYDSTRTPKIHRAAGLEYDTSLGFRDTNGFRAGCCIPFFPYDHETGQTISVIQFPLVIMDGVLFDREASSTEEAWSDVKGLLTHVKDTRGCCSILWHNHVFDETIFPGWKEVYSRTLEWISSNGGWAGPCNRLKDHINGR